jgi:hypothetical protein
MLLQNGCRPAGDAFSVNLISGDCQAKSPPRSRPVNPHSTGGRGWGMRERNTARNEGVLRTIKGFESFAHLAHFLPPYLHYGRYDLCSE